MFLVLTGKLYIVDVILSYLNSYTLLKISLDIQYTNNRRKVSLTISDHCPIWLMCSRKDWGLKPFRVCNGWLDHVGFKDFVVLQFIVPFSEEVKDEVWGCDGNKSLGLDDFNFNFIKSCWGVLKDDILGFFNEFHISAVMPKAFTASFLALIPKKDHPQGLKDFRPICLIESIYKILAKVLAKRLKKVLGGIISNFQSAFLPGRQILDGVLVFNEIVDLAKRKKECLLFKVDFEKAYDSIS